MKKLARGILIFLFTLLGASVVWAGDLTLPQAHMELEVRLSKVDASNSNASLLDFLKGYKKSDFANEGEYLRFLNGVQDLFLEDQEGYLDLLFYVGKGLQNHKRFLEAYPYLYKISLRIEKEHIKPTFICTYYEVMGHSYYFFGRQKQAEEMFDKGLNCEGITKHEQLNMYNTSGLIRLQIGDLEGAERNYRKALGIADETNHKPWYGVLSGNLGQLYYQRGEYKRSVAYLTTDYTISRENEQWGSAINALALLMRIDLRNGKFSEANHKLETLDSLLQFDESRDVRLTYYRAKTDYLEKTGNYKDALENYKLFRAYFDTIARERDMLNLNNTEFQIEFERKQSEIRLLQNTREADRSRIFSLWIFLGTIVAAATSIIWQISKRRKREKELLQLKNERIQEDLLRSEEELRNLLSKLIQKNESITQLHEELEKANSLNDKSDEEQQELTDRLQSFTLLTDEDWLEFKRLFEKRFAGFFEYFQTNYDDITNAEIRLAALIKLDLENLEMSKALGISPDSVRKTNLRLRKKLGIADQKELYRLIHSI